MVEVVEVLRLAVFAERWGGVEQGSGVSIWEPGRLKSRFLRWVHSGRGKLRGETGVLFQPVGWRGSWTYREDGNQAFDTPVGSLGGRCLGIVSEQMVLEARMGCRPREARVD